jgi:hypothetical protein
MEGSQNFQNIYLSFFVEKTKEKNCKDLGIGEDLMKFEKTTTPQSFILFFFFKKKRDIFIILI